jgi:hypothetical protein
MIDQTRDNKAANAWVIAAFGPYSAECSYPQFAIEVDGGRKCCARAGHFFELEPSNRGRSGSEV